MTETEKRKQERLTLKLPITLTLESENGEERILELASNDICSGGVFVETNEPLLVGSSLRIDIVLPLDELKKLDGKRAHIKVSGAILRASEHGVAIKFNEDYEILPAALKSV